MEDFIIPHNVHKISSPLKDEISRPVMESSNQVALSLIKGHSPEEANQKSMQTYDHWIHKILDSSDLEAPHILKYLLWNKENQILIQN